MSREPVHRAPRTKTRPAEHPARPLTYCGYCAGWRRVWCLDCAGLAGCVTCAQDTTVPCPVCAGGVREKRRP